MTSTQIKIEIINYKNKVELKNSAKIDLKTFQNMLFENIPVITKYTDKEMYQKNIFDTIVKKIEKSENSNTPITELTLQQLKDNILLILSKNT